MTEILLATALLVALVLGLSLGVIFARRILAPSHPVQLTINETQKLTGVTGDKLLTTLKNHDILIPSACAGGGTCGLCRVVVAGQTDKPLLTEEARLSPAELRSGMRLACQMVVRGPLSLQIPDAFLSAETLQCAVKSSKMLAPLIKEVVLSLPDDAAFTPRPGAYIQVTAPAYKQDFSTLEVEQAHERMWARMGWHELQINSETPETRAYSLANTPENTREIVLTIRLAVPPPGAGADVPPGVVSSFLFAASVGDSIEISGPFGDFGARNSKREMVFIGGGVGMAPLRSIIHDELEHHNTTRKISYWYGARSQSDAFYTEAFEALEKAHSNFRFTLALSDPDPEQKTNARTGFIHEVALSDYLNDHPAPEECEYYLCGPPLMINAVRAMLDSIGVEEDMIYFDDFGA